MLTFIGVAVYSIFTLIYLMHIKMKIDARINVVNERINGMWDELKKVSQDVEDMRDGVTMVRRGEDQRIRETVALNLRIKELENAMKVILQTR